MNISSVSKSTFQHYYTHFLLPNRHRIQTLYISDPFIIDFFSSPTEDISKCTQLQTLILNEIETPCLENLLIGLVSLRKLSSLTIHIGHDSNKIHIYTLIFQLPVLNYCNISFEENIPLGLLPIATNPSSPIQHLIIKDNYDLNEVDAILSYVPHLRRLSIEYQYRPHSQEAVIFLMILNNSAHVCVTGDRLSYRIIEEFVKTHYHQIKILHISSTWFSFYYQAWEKTMSSYIPHLHVVDLYKSNIHFCGHTTKIYQSVYGPCGVSLPRIQQRFFTHEPMSEKYLHEIFCSIRLYR